MGERKTHEERSDEKNRNEASTDVRLWRVIVRR